MAAQVSIVPVGTRWPSGNCTSAGVVALDASNVDEVARGALSSGIEAGLGAWVGFGVRLPSGRLVELVNYIHSPEPRGFEVRVDSGDNCREVFAELLRVFTVNPDAVLWVPPACES